ncbi:hypothetical protein MCHLDSM_01130 [Mycolicibacterium chlorophenolicum]|uniref:UsfY protein n=2 Tax=Mycolicibacterium chlorophenolicum TaxID=37916 RepID=A0A0J6WLE4_9MYCO|nr:hypothetical protein MCHLDSM_01130 [Mycolicibacterium chlorophenolicum]
MPGLIAVGVSSALIFTSLFAFAVGHVEAGVIAAVLAVALIVGGLTWLTVERRRVRRIEVIYLQAHPEPGPR